MRAFHAALVLFVVAVAAGPVAGGEDLESARKLAAQLTDGNEHREGNNAVVEKLVAHGPKSILPLLQCVNDPEFEGQGYAAWALAEVVRGTGADPTLVVPTLRVAARSDDDYVRTLARSALDTLGVSVGSAVRRRAPAAAFEPNPYVLAALKDAPGPDAPIEDLVAQMGERKGHWRGIVVDRLVARGEAAAGPLLRAAGDAGYPARAYAAWGLARLHRALGQTPEEVVTVLRGLEKAESDEVRRYAAAGARILAQATPLGQADGRSLTPEAIAAAMLRGRGEPATNNVLVDQLLLHGEKALPALVRASKDPAFPNRFYADWAIAKILRATGARPEEIVAHLKARYRPGQSPISILGH